MHARSSGYGEGWSLRNIGPCSTRAGGRLVGPAGMRQKPRQPLKGGLEVGATSPPAEKDSSSCGSHGNIADCCRRHLGRPCIRRHVTCGGKDLREGGMSGPASTGGNEGSSSLLFREPYSSSPGENRVCEPYSILAHPPTRTHLSVSSCGIYLDRLRLTGTVTPRPFSLTLGTNTASLVPYDWSMLSSQLQMF